MPSERRSPQQILQDAIVLRAEGFRRWRQAADVESSARTRRLYQALAQLECDRFDRLMALRRPGESEGAGARSFELPRGARPREPAMRAAGVAAEAERRTWEALLRRTPSHQPQHRLLSDLADDARRLRDVIAGHRASTAREGSAQER